MRSSTQSGFFDKAFTITITDINEQPTLDVIADQALCSTNTIQTIPVSGISSGPESAQSNMLSISSDNPGLFDQFNISNMVNGIATISYQLKNGASGTANLIVKVKDNGGTVNGGIDEIIRTLKLTVNGLPDNLIISNKGNSITEGETAILTATGGTTYVWADANGIISGQNTAFLTIRPSQSPLTKY
ncbi:MAG: hypothetical protein WBP45_00450 [Daejeonella sp.]